MTFIGGIEYEPVSPGSYTVAYDLYMHGVLKEIGVEHLAQAGRQGDLRGFLEATVRKDALGRLVAGLVQPKGKSWSIEHAESVAERFARATDPGDKQAILTSLAEGLERFFGPGLRSLPIFRRSSAPAFRTS